jgi:hypothetical protein
MFQTIDEIEGLVRGFESHELPRSQWTHGAHLTVALWYLLHYPPAEATQHIRTKIQQYNAAKCIATTPIGGYHETLTLFWIRIVDRFLAERQATDCPVDLCRSLIQQCGDPGLPLQYYSHDRLFSWEARTRWVEPNLLPL